MVSLVPQPLASAPAEKLSPSVAQGQERAQRVPRRPRGELRRGCPCSTPVAEAAAQMAAPQGTSPGPGRRHTLRRDKRNRAAPTPGPGSIVAGCAEYTPAWICRCQGAKRSKAELAGLFCHVPRAPGPGTGGSPPAGAGVASKTEAHACVNFFMEPQTLPDRPGYPWQSKLPCRAKHRSWYLGLLYFPNALIRCYITSPTASYLSSTFRQERACEPAPSPVGCQP